MKTVVRAVKFCHKNNCHITVQKLVMPHCNWISR